MSLKIHVICLALNEEIFIEEFLKSLYPFVQGISVITQYDRDFYGNILVPDKTVDKVLNFPDKEGKIHLVVRRFKDETAARNHEILSLNLDPAKKIISHGVNINEINNFYSGPDYFLIADADEIYDQESFQNILDYLELKKPNGLRITGYNYCWTWNQRVPLEYEHFKHFGFIKSNLIFKMRRQINFTEGRIQKLLKLLKIRDFSAQLFGFRDCPIEVGVFHHGWFLGDENRHRKKLSQHSHKLELDIENFIQNLKNVPTIEILNNDLPKNLINGKWPKEFFLNDNKNN